MSEFRQFCIAAMAVPLIVGTLSILGIYTVRVGPDALSAASFLSGCWWIAFHGKRAK